MRGRWGRGEGLRPRGHGLAGQRAVRPSVLPWLSSLEPAPVAARPSRAALRFADEGDFSETCDKIFRAS